jgi:hypothetical protein
MPEVDGLAGEDTVVVDDESSRDVGQECLDMRQLPEEPVSRILQDERASGVDGADVPDGVEQTGVEDIRYGGLVGDRVPDTADATAVRILPLAGATSGGGARRAAHHFNDVDNGGIA